MRISTRTATLATVMLALILGVGDAAFAQESAAQEPLNRSWSAEVSPAESKARLTPQQRNSAGTSCKTASAQRLIPSQAYYTQTVDWCYDMNYIIGTPVAAVTVSAGPQINFVGNINQTRAWVQQPVRYRAYTQGHFNADGIPFTNWYPWVDMTLRPAGQWTYTTGG